MSLFSSFEAPASGVLTVTVIEGRDLHSEDTFGTNDPFIELWLDEDYKQRTSEVQSSNEPTWNESFTFNIEQGSSHHKIYFKVLDKDLVGDDTVGKGKIDIAEALEGSPIDTWVSLPAHLHLTSHGEIHFFIQFEAL
ncbi:C2 domain-containing protein [Phycomyces nitens]|nr:C2 domain-containing protein [Phycomyces nitens]